MSKRGGARPVTSPADKRLKAKAPRSTGRSPFGLRVIIGKEAMASLRLLAAASETSVEALAAGWLGERISKEWEEYSTQVSCLLEEWKEEIL